MKHLNRQRLAENIEEIARYDFDNQKVFGSSYAVVQEDKVIYKKHFGHTSVQGDAEVSDDTLYRLASMTKPITAFATLILVEREKLSLSDNVSKYLPEFENIHIIQEDADGAMDLGKPVHQPTIRDLLTHTSGIGTDARKLEKMTTDDKSTVEKTIAYFANAGLDFEPASKQAYSAFGAFDVLVKIIQKITGTDYESFLQKEIFQPCGMKNTVFVPSQKQWDHFIQMHNKVNGTSVNATMKKDCVFETFPCTHYLGGAGLASTLKDYIEFAKLLLKEGATSQKALISKETFQVFRTPLLEEKIMPGSQKWGLGVRVIVHEHYRDLPVGSFGWSGAYGSHFWIDPKNKVAAVFMKNSLYDGGAGNESARNFEKAVNSSFET